MKSKIVLCKSFSNLIERLLSPRSHLAKVELLQLVLLANSVIETPREVRKIVFSFIILKIK